MELKGTGLGKRDSALSKGHRTVSGRFRQYYWRLVAQRLRQTCFVPECNWSRSFPPDRMTAVGTLAYRLLFEEFARVYGMVEVTLM